MMPKRALPILAGLALWPALASGQVPVGSEFRVNGGRYFQGEPAIAADTDGTFLVAWQTNGYWGSEYNIQARRYGFSGLILGPPSFMANSYVSGDQVAPSVTANASTLVFVWESNGQDGSAQGIFGRLFDTFAPSPLGPEFAINTYTTGAQRRPRVSLDGDGDLVVVWQSNGEGPGYGIFGRRYDEAGTPQGSEFRISNPASEGRFPDVASHASGSFVVVWESQAQDGSLIEVVGQRYDSTAATIGSEFKVNTHTTGDQVEPRVAYDGDGNFVVVWASSVQDGSSYGVFGQRYDFAGVARGGEFQVNSYTTGAQYHPTVAADSTGSFVVAWISQGQDGDALGVFGRRYDRFGAPEGLDFQVNSFTTSSQSAPAVGSAADGRFIVVWQSAGQDEGSYGVFGQRFRPDVIFKDGFQAP